MTISFSKKEIDSLKHATLTETGLREEVFSIMMTRLSWSGSMRKINLELFPCSQVQPLRKFLIDFAELHLRSKNFANSLMMNILDTLHLAQQTWELPLEDQCTSNYQN